MDITAEDIFTIINKVRENPSLVVNEIKDQLKRYALYPTIQVLVQFSLQDQTRHQNTHPVW